MQSPRTPVGLATIALLAALIATALANESSDVAEVEAAAAAFDCTQGCKFVVQPVCGLDGEWYQNECLAVCSGQVKAANASLCDDKPLPFMGARPGPLNAESAGGNASELLVPPSVVTQFIEEGFRYVGRIRLAHELGPRPEPALVQPPPEKDVDGDWTAKAVRCTSDGDVYVGRMKIPNKLLKAEGYMPPWMGAARPLGTWDSLSGTSGAGNGSALLRGFVSGKSFIPPPSALRMSGLNGSRMHLGPPAFNMTGDDLGGRSMKDMFFAWLLDGGSSDGRDKGLLDGFFNDLFARFWGAAQQQQISGSPTMAAAGQQAAPDRPTSETAASDQAASEQQDAAAVENRRKLLQARLLRELVGSDDRQDCQQGFPYTAIGQIQVMDNTGMYICTGTLIAPDKVLTAGHCVWNIKRGAFYYNLNYAPGRYRDGEKVVNPWGVVPWKSVTVFDSFKKNPSTWDVAVVTLSKPLGSLTGYMGIAAGCGRNLQLTTAGYPNDKAAGTCSAAVCMQRTLNCDNPTNPHLCDTKTGMSGSPLWDGKNRVRLIHVAGIEGRDVNRATTLTQFVVNTVTKW